MGFLAKDPAERRSNWRPGCSARLGHLASQPIGRPASVGQRMTSQKPGRVSIGLYGIEGTQGGEDWIPRVVKVRRVGADLAPYLGSARIKLFVLGGNVMNLDAL